MFDDANDKREWFLGMLVIAVVLVVLASPVVALSLGLSVRLFRWVAGN